MMLNLRPATLDDAQRVFAWRNSEEVRRFSISNREIGWDEHFSWFQGVLENPQRHMFVAEREGEPVGVFRLDWADGRAEVSIFLAPGMSGQGLGAAILHLGIGWARENLAGVTKLIARIKAQNEASLHLFGKVGFEEAYRVFELDMVKKK